MPEIRREDLIKAAKELNDILGLDPQIKTGKKVTEKELSEQILEAAELILPEDDISEETMRVIKLLKDESVEEEDEEEVDTESEPEEDDDEVEEEEELEEDTEVEELEEVEEEVDMESEPEEDTEVEEFEEDEDSETEEEEVEDEVDEPEKIKSETKKGKKESASKNDRPKSNKAIVYEAWKSNITDIKELAAKVNNEVKEATIKIWITHWKKGKDLPAIARKKDDK